MMRMVMVLVGVVSAAIVLGALWIDEGEVVALLTTDADSNVHRTDLWSVELDGVHYLRASNSSNKWLVRLRERPVVELDSGSASAVYRAMPLDDADLRARVNAAMARKYGFADRLWGAWDDRSASIPIQLEPAEDLLSARGDAS